MDFKADNDKDDAGQELKAKFAASITFAVKAYMLREGIDVYTAASEAINMANMTTTEICIAVLAANNDDYSEGKAQEGGGMFPPLPVLAPSSPSLVQTGSQPVQSACPSLPTTIPYS